MIYFEKISGINDRIIYSILINFEICGAHTPHVPTQVLETHVLNAGLITIALLRNISLVSDFQLFVK